MNRRDLPDTVAKEIVIQIDRSGDLPKRIETAPSIPTGLPRPVRESNAISKPTRGGGLKRALDYHGMTDEAIAFGIWIVIVGIAGVIFLAYCFFSDLRVRAEYNAGDREPHQLYQGNP